VALFTNMSSELTYNKMLISPVVSIMKIFSLDLLLLLPLQLLISILVIDVNCIYLINYFSLVTLFKEKKTHPVVVASASRYVFKYYPMM